MADEWATLHSGGHRISNSGPRLLASLDSRPDNLLLLLSYLIPTGNVFPVSPLQGSLPLLSWGLHSSRTPDGGDQVEEGKDEGPSTQTCLGYNL